MKGEVAGLGFWSEQSMESAHHDFKLEWEKVKVSANHVEYPERLFNTVVRYAGKHLDNFIHEFLVRNHYDKTRLYFTEQ